MGDIMIRIYALLAAFFILFSATASAAPTAPPQSEEEYKHVVENHRLPNGLLFGLPVVFDTSREDIKTPTLVFRNSVSSRPRSASRTSRLRCRRDTY